MAALVREAACPPDCSSPPVSRQLEEIPPSPIRGDDSPSQQKQGRRLRWALYSYRLHDTFTHVRLIGFQFTEVKKELRFSVFTEIGKLL